MVVCRYFLAGQCKYGDRCYNEHPRGSGPAAGGGGGGRGVTFRDSFGTGAGSQQAGQNPYKWTAASPQQQHHQQQQQVSSISAHDIVKSLPKEMEVWQTSKMWPFSCFSLEKDLPSLPEFTDMSPEELRVEAYNAIQQGSTDAYKQRVAQLAQEFRQKQDQIRAMPDPLRQNLTQLLEEGRRQKAAKVSGQSVVRPSTFGGGQSGGSSVFGSAAGGSSVFGNSSSSSSVFGSGGGSTTTTTGLSGSTFGMGATAMPPSVFGGSQQPSSSAGSVFGGGGGQTAIPASGAPSLFGQTSPAPGLFGSGAPAGSSSSGGSVFGGGGGGLFGQPGGGGVPAPGLFGKGGGSSSTGGGGFGQQPASTGSVFGQPSSGSVFGQSGGGGGGLFGKPPSSSSSSTPSVFGQASAPVPGLFGASPAQSSSVFGGSSAVGSAMPQPGLFGAASGGATGGSTFGGAAQAGPVDSGSLYTPLAELTDSEKAQFEAKMFSPGMIPMKPPPKELINI